LSVGKSKTAKAAYGIAGLEDIVAALKKLPNDISLKYQTQALRKAAKPGQEALRREVSAIRQVTGNLLASVTKVERKYTNNKAQIPVSVVVIGFRRPVGSRSQKGAVAAFAGGSVLKGPNRAFHSHLVEYGTRPRTPGKSRVVSRRRVIVGGRIRSITERAKVASSPSGILSSFKSRGPFVGGGTYPKDFIARGTVAGSPARHPLKKAFQSSKAQMQSVLDAEMRKALTRAVKEYERRYGDSGGLL
jgi:HK97 gp10 family phage protein